MNAKIIGTGCQLPAYAADNHYLSTLVETSDEWITERTGIRMRHLAQKETTTSLSVDAAGKALASAGKAYADTRPVMIHCQTVRDDQLDEMKKIGSSCRPSLWHIPITGGMCI